MPLLLPIAIRCCTYAGHQDAEERYSRIGLLANGDRLPIGSTATLQASGSHSQVSDRTGFVYASVNNWPAMRYGCRSLRGLSDCVGWRQTTPVFFPDPLRRSLASLRGRRTACRRPPTSSIELPDIYSRRRDHRHPDVEPWTIAETWMDIIVSSRDAARIDPRPRQFHDTAKSKSPPT